MDEALELILNSRGGPLLIIGLLFFGAILGLFYRYKFFSSKEYLHMYAYSKTEVSTEIEKLKQELVPERIFDIKLESIKKELKLMDEKQEDRYERLRESLSNLQGSIRTMHKNI